MNSGESSTSGGLLIGRYASKMGAKGRVAVPHQLRDHLGDKVIISQGYEKSLLLVSRGQWEKLTEFLRGRPVTMGPVRDTERFLFGSAYEAEFDDQGRVVIPQELRDFAGLTDEAVFLGVGNRVEVWSRTNWDRYSKNLEGEIEKVAEKLGNEISPTRSFT